MTRDLKSTADAVRRAIEEYGSAAHLATELGVGLPRLLRWRDGLEPMPLEAYEKLIELLAKRTR